MTTLMLSMTMLPFAAATEARSSVCTGDVCINELLPNPAGSDTGNYPAGEWVELHNDGTSDINLQGWTLEDAGGWVHPIDSNTWVDFSSLATPFVLPAGDYAIIAENSQGTLKINNAGETLHLKDGSGSTVHTVTTGQANNDVSKIPGAGPTDDYVDSASNTPGAANGGVGTGPEYVQTELRIMEVMPDPYWSDDNATWPGGEWIEIANVGQAAVDLAGWQVEDAAGNSMAMNTTHLVGSGTIISPGEHRIVAVNGTRQYGMLNNGAGTEFIRLLLPGGEIAHQVEYTGPTNAGHSYVNATGGLPEWGLNNAPLVTSMWPTPAALNPQGALLPDTWQLNELMVNGTVEWVELHLALGPAVDLSTYQLRTGTGRVIPFDCSTLIDCSDTLLEEGDFEILEFQNELLDLYDSVALVDANGDARQLIEWRSQMPDNQSIIPADPLNALGPWMFSPYNTPGAANPGQETGGTNDEAVLRISEILPNPVGADTQPGMLGEWVEVTNIGNDTVDLAGWELRSGAGMALPPVMLDPGALVALPLSNTSLTLTNAQGTLKLNDPLGETAHTVVWTGSAIGATLVPGLADIDPWVLSPWPTPGQANPLFEQPYSGPNEVLMTEVSAQCSEPSDGLGGEWVELRNGAGFPVNLSRWSVQDEAGNAVAVQPGALWNHTPDSLVVEADAFAVVHILDSLLTNLGEKITLLDPNGQAVQSLSWSSSEDCETLESRDGGEATRQTLWPTPGAENPAIQPYDGAMTLKFTRMMPGEVPNRDNDWFEVTNTGETWVDLGGWIIARHRSNGPWNSTFNNHMLEPGQSLVVSVEPANLLDDGGPQAEDGDALFGGNSPWLVNSGGALQLVAPDGTVVDAFVYGAGEADIEGWTGLALEMPPSDVAGLILMRGDGCGDLPDTDSAADWSVRWLRLGSTLFCDDGMFSTTGDMTPVISPDGGLQQMVDWIGGATTSFHLHVYQFSSPELFDAIEAAVGRGVECTVLLEGEILGDAGDGANQRGWADALFNAGCTVLWMVEPSGTDAPAGPYRYIHSKVAVKDGASVWIGSGNWKRSTFPVDGDAGNRDAGIIIDSIDLADLVLTRMLADEDDVQRHILDHADAPSSMGAPVGWSPMAAEPFSAGSTVPPTFTGPISGRLLTCPDDCIEGLIWTIDEADETLDLSLQYLDLGWHWGYGDNPLIEAIERAAGERDVQVRLLINGHYVNEDPDIRETVNHFNHRFNMTHGWDVEARLMAPGDGITKLHDKSVVVDGELVLYSSINWGSNSALRNREMGIALQHTGLAAQQQSIFDTDWERLDANTDTDGDGMPDVWEIANGLNRSWSAVAGTAESEQNLDLDGDGLSNLLEFETGGDPRDADTDDDCVEDGDEVVWARSHGIAESLAVQTADADLDGEADNVTVGCSDASPPIEPPAANETPTDQNEEPAGPFRDNAMDSTAAKILLAMVILAAISLAGAATMLILSRQRSRAGEVLIDDAEAAMWEEENTPEPAPAPTPEADTAPSNVILDGTSVGPNASSEAREVAVGRDDGVFGAPQLDGYGFPEWTPQFVQDHLPQGWTVDQLREKYEKEHA